MTLNLPSRQFTRHDTHWCDTCGQVRQGLWTGDPLHVMDWRCDTCGETEGAP